MESIKVEESVSATKEIYALDGESRYRYLLSSYINLNELNTVTAIMFNPSCGNILYDDSTIMKLKQELFSEKYNYKKINIVNLFPYVSKSIIDVKKSKKNFDRENMKHIKSAIDESDTVIIAPGYADNKLKIIWKMDKLKEIQEIEKYLSKKNKKTLYIEDKKKNAKGKPAHPLYADLNNLRKYRFGTIEKLVKEANKKKQD